MASCQVSENALFALKADTHYATHHGAATRCLVCTASATRLLALILSLRYQSRFKPVWIRATDSSDKDFYMSHDAICYFNPSRRRVAAICRIVCLGLYVFAHREHYIHESLERARCYWRKRPPFTFDFQVRAPSVSSGLLRLERVTEQRVSCKLIHSAPQLLTLKMKDSLKMPFFTVKRDFCLLWR